MDWDALEKAGKVFELEWRRSDWHCGGSAIQLTVCAVNFTWKKGVKCSKYIRPNTAVKNDNLQYPSAVRICGRPPLCYDGATFLGAPVIALPADNTRVNSLSAFQFLLPYRTRRSRRQKWLIMRFRVIARTETEKAATNPISGVEPRNWCLKKCLTLWETGLIYPQSLFLGSCCSQNSPQFGNTIDK